MNFIVATQPLKCVIMNSDVKYVAGLFLITITIDDHVHVLQRRDKLQVYQSRNNDDCGNENDYRYYNINIIVIATAAAMTTTTTITAMIMGMMKRSKKKKIITPLGPISGLATLS